MIHAATQGLWPDSLATKQPVPLVLAPSVLLPFPSHPHLLITTTATSSPEPRPFTKSVVMWRCPWGDEYDNDNAAIARRIKRQNWRNKINHTLNRCLKLDNPPATPPTALDKPKNRPFRWMIQSYHVPEEYQAPDLRDFAPWYLVLRHLLVKFPTQLENLPGQLENNVSVKAWRNHLVEDQKEPEYLQRPFHSRGCHQKWGRRLVFSQQTEEEPRSLIGQWMVVAYIWSDSREWLKNIDARKLVSFSNAVE